jgi:hypothetical protein
MSISDFYEGVAKNIVEVQPTFFRVGQQQSLLSSS